MNVKLFEVRDIATFIPCWAIRMAPTRVHALGIDIEYREEKYLLRRSGFGFDNPLVMFGRLDGGESQYDPHAWNGRARTMPIAHQHITAHWNELESGDVIDVQFILGEMTEPKVSEAYDTSLPSIDGPTNPMPCPHCNELVVINGYCGECERTINEGDGR